jgi:glycosyltransferase involved in cell wall biosynthesis
MKATGIEGKLPRIAAPVTAVVLSTDQSVYFSLELKEMDPLLTLVIDAYPCARPQHPQRHFGWFQFSDLTDGIYRFRFCFGGGPVSVELESGDQPVACWVNEDFDRQDALPLSLRVVLRHKLNNRIVFEDAVIVYAAQCQYEEQQRYFEQRRQLMPQGLAVQSVLDPTRRVAIVVKELRDYDAIGYFCWESWALLRANNIEALLYVGSCDNKFRPFVRNVHELLDEPELSKLTVFYHLSIYDPALEWLNRLPCAKAAFFHGITDPANLRVFDGELARFCEEGQRQLPLLGSFDRLFANSCFSRDILAAQLPPEARLPLVLPPLATVRAVWDAMEPDPEVSAHLAGDLPMILYVGRLFPNKRLEDLFAVFEHYVRLAPTARLVLVGGSHDSYQRYLEYKLSLMPESVAGQIHFLPGLSKSGLKAAYQQATCFVTMSSHEGFCIPLLEAMVFDLPIVARHCTAIPEVLGGAGKLFRKFDPVVIAREIDRLHSDSGYRQQVITRQRSRLADFSDERVALNLLEALTGWEEQDEGLI